MKKIVRGAGLTSLCLALLYGGFIALVEYDFRSQRGPRRPERPARSHP